MRWILFLLLLTPISSLSAQALNAGFVQGLWYSKTPFFAQDTIRIYTAIQNNSGFDIQGTVEFLVNGQSIGESSFSAIAGRVVETWIDWNVPQGNHSITAAITESFKMEIGKEPEPISLENASVGVTKVFADDDTDKDGIGNLQDPDDDNDGISDAKEKILGTDPLKPNPIENKGGGEKTVQLQPDPFFQDTQEQKTTEEKPLVKELSEKVANEYVPKIKERVESLVQTATKRLQEQKEKLEQKKQSAQQLSLPEQGFYLLLTTSIALLPQWQIVLFLFFALAAVLLLRRLAGNK